MGSRKNRLGRAWAEKPSQRDAKKMPKRCPNGAKHLQKGTRKQVWKTRLKKVAKKGTHGRPKPPKGGPEGPKWTPRATQMNHGFAHVGPRGAHGAKMEPKSSPKEPQRHPEQGQHALQIVSYPVQKIKKRPLQKQLRKRTPSTPRTKRNNSNNNNS